MKIVQAVRMTSAEVQTIELVGSLLDELESCDRVRSDELLSQIDEPLSRIHSRVASELVFGAAVAHPNLLVRRRLIDFVVEKLPFSTAADTLATLARDPEDAVCLPAMKAAGSHRVARVLQYMVDIVNWPHVMHATPRKPVGLGAATVYKSLCELLDVRDWADRASQHEWMTHGRLPRTLDVELKFDVDVGAAMCAQRGHTEAFIPGGWSDIGLPESRVPFKDFGFSDSVGPARCWLPPFLIDVLPVCAGEYDAFCASSEATTHDFCHPLEPVGKDHRRNTWWDDRFKLDQPVTGVDWFDAYAYARWADKELPTEYQWEKAARGPECTVWPWGEAWDPDACRWTGTTFESRPTGLSEWRDLLASVTEFYPSELVVSAKEHEAFASAYGPIGMVGNAWEWTLSESSTGEPFSPAAQAESDRPMSVVLKGGAWSSMPGQMYPSYRGLDAPICRHNEIGFRCVRNLSSAVLGPAIANALPSRNSAVY